MNRTFVFSYRKCLGPVGGGTGVNYKLFLANSEYHLLDDCYHVFKDKVLEPGTETVNYKRLTPDNREKNGIRTMVSHFGPAWFYKHQRYRYKIRKYLKELDNKYSFSENDVYIFQDIESANEFIRMFPFRNTLFVYHQQGSLYNEWRSFNSYELSTYKRYLNQYSAKAYDNVAVLGFPSNGAKESLLESEPYFEKSVNKRETKVLYNGFTKPESLPNNLSLETEYIYSKLRGFDGIVFCTVSALNEAKAVERIPQYLTQVKKKHKIKWIVVGNGIKSEELQQEINKYNLSENVIWQKHPLSHAEILKLFELTDFYIMFHRFSIFDYSTIEALAYGCIPVLTPVGGNKEVIFENNGIFVDDFGNCDSFENFVSSKDIPTVKKINQEIQNDRFSNYAFLKRYSELVLKLREGRI